MALTEGKALMFKRLVFAVCVLVAVAGKPARADDVMILNDASGIIAGGRVTGIGNGIFTIDHNGREIGVSTAEIEIGRETLDALVQLGAYVTVQGSIERGNVIEARRVIRSEEPPMIGEEALQMLGDEGIGDLGRGRAPDRDRRARSGTGGRGSP